MEDLALISSIWLIHVLAWLTPGPMFVLIVRNSLVYCRRAGIWTAVGITVGACVHMLIALIAIRLALEVSDSFTSVVSLIGAAYLAYLGIKTLRIKPPQQEVGNPRHKQSISDSKAFMIGMVGNILSPKAFLFFISVFSLAIVKVEQSWFLYVLILLLCLNCLVFASLYSIFFTHPSIRDRYYRYQLIANKILGLALLVFAGIIVWGVLKF